MVIKSLYSSVHNVPTLTEMRSTIVRVHTTDCT